GIRDDLVTGVQTCALPIFEREFEVVGQRHDDVEPLEILGGEVERAAGPDLVRADADWLVTTVHRMDRLLRLGLFVGIHDTPFWRSEERRVGKEWQTRETEV